MGKNVADKMKAMAKKAGQASGGSVSVAAKMKQAANKANAPKKHKPY